MLFSSHFFEHPAEDLHALDNFIVRWSREIESDGVALSVDIGQKCSAGDERDHVLGGFLDKFETASLVASRFCRTTSCALRLCSTKTASRAPRLKASIPSCPLPHTVRA